MAEPESIQTVGGKSVWLSADLNGGTAGQTHISPGEKPEAISSTSINQPR